MIIRRKLESRNRGYSIESIAMGAILILFAIPLMISIFSLVQRQVNFYGSSEFFPVTISEIRRTFQDHPDYDSVNNRIIIQTGVVPDKMIDDSAQDGILLPYEGSVEFSPARGGTHFSATVTWPSSTFNRRAFCVKMSKAEPGVNSSGILGLLYEIESVDCQAEQPFFVVVYERI